MIPQLDNTPRGYLTHMGLAFRYQANPSLDPVRSLGVNHPERFALLTSAWQGCLDTSNTIHVRYREDRRNSALAVHAAAIRDFALDRLKRTWELIVDGYLSDIAEAEKKED